MLGLKSTFQNKGEDDEKAFLAVGFDGLWFGFG